MVIAVPDAQEEEFRKIVDQVAEICLSKRFGELRRELEGIYARNHIENALLTAFQDALYVMLAEREALQEGKNLIY